VFQFLVADARAGRVGVHKICGSPPLAAGRAQAYLGPYVRFILCVKASAHAVKSQRSVAVVHERGAACFTAELFYTLAVCGVAGDQVPPFREKG
jgi:hypothetical protein